jgi:hypothetical protein
MCHDGFGFFVLWLLLFMWAMLMVMIVAVIASSICPLTHALVSAKTLQFAFVMHGLQGLIFLWQYLLSWYENCRDTHNTLTMPLLRLLMRLPCGFEVDCHGLTYCV